MEASMKKIIILAITAAALNANAGSENVTLHGLNSIDAKLCSVSISGDRVRTSYTSDTIYNMNPVDGQTWLGYGNDDSDVVGFSLNKFGKIQAFSVYKMTGMTGQNMQILGQCLFPENLK
jgi:hypothetical protein